MANDRTTDNRGQSKNTAKEPDAKRAAKTKQHHRWRLLTMLVTLAVAAWCLPIVVAKTPLLTWILKMATADLGGSVSVKSASFGWLSPIEVQDVEVKDKEGKQVLTVASVVGDRRLGAILFNYSNLGKFTLSGAKLSVVMRDDGTNVEDLLAKYLVPKKTSSSTKIGLVVDIVDGAASVTDELTGLVWQVQKLSVKFDMADGPDGPIGVDVASDLRDTRGAGKLTAGIKMGPAASEAKLSVEQFPLAMLRPLAARFMPGTTVTGRLSSEIAATWGGKAGDKNGVEGRLSVQGFSLATRAMQTDVLQLAGLRADCRASWQPDRLDIEKSSIQCDVGNATLVGTIPLGGKDGLSLSAILHQRQEFRGGVDLARLAQLLPATLNLRQQMQINSGQVQWVLSSLPDQQGTRWHGQLEAGNLTATDAAKRQIAWNKPILAMFDAREGSTGLVVDRLLCESDFLHVEGAGTADNLTAKLTFSLNKLAEQLGQFTTFGNAKFAGEGDGNLTWKRSPDHLFDAGANVQVRGFQLQMAGEQKNQPAWREDSLLVYVSAKGQTNFDVNTRIDAATLNVTSGFDQIDAKIMEPVKDLQGGGVWRVSAQIKGQLQNWPARLALWLPMNNCQLAGGYIVAAEGVASKDGAELRQFGFAAEPLIVKSPLLNINETRIEGSAAGSWNGQQRRLQVPAASIKCATAAVDANNVVIALPASGSTELAGTIQYRGDAGRMRLWFANPKTTADWRLAGQFEGSLALQQNAGLVHGATTTKLTNLAVVSGGKQFQEPIVQLVAQGDYDPKLQTLLFTRCELTSSALSAAAAGRVSPASGQENGQIEGKLRYDLERLSGLLRPCLGSNVSLAGRGDTSASYRGPFALGSGAAAAAFRWDGAKLYGFSLGPAEMKATLANGVVQVEPLDLPVGGGKVHLAPRLQLTSAPMEFSLPRGPLVQKVQIDPAMCGSLLQYAAPALAGVTTAQGTFSIDLDECRIPIGDLDNANVSGRLTIHSMAIGPGPMTRELATFMSREAPAQLRKESVVPFQMVKGRVYHKDLELIFPDITIRSSGWVKVSDQTMELLIQMPVPPKWQAGNNLLSQAARNQVLSVPLRGTLAKQTLDPKVLQDLTRQFAQKAVGNVIEGQLNKLFTPKR
jgi:translocation and assembly module TamB